MSKNNFTYNTLFRIKDKYRLSVLIYYILIDEKQILSQKNDIPTFSIHIRAISINHRVIVCSSQLHLC